MLVAACGGQVGPRLDRAQPAAAARGAAVTLSGAGLCGTSDDCMAVTSTIQIGLDLPVISAPITSYSSTTATIVIPDLAPLGATELVVTVNDHASNALGFEVLP